MAEKSPATLNTVVQFAHFLNAGYKPGAAVAEARDRGWVDSEGNVTKDGRELADALETQRHTRTVFRSVG